MSDSTNAGVTYEYKVFTLEGNQKKIDSSWRPVGAESETELNALIRDGWELVSTHAGQVGYSVFGTGQWAYHLNVVLRRAAT